MSFRYSGTMFLYLGIPFQKLGTAFRYLRMSLRQWGMRFRYLWMPLRQSGTRFLYQGKVFRSVLLPQELDFTQTQLLRLKNPLSLRISEPPDWTQKWIY